MTQQKSTRTCAISRAAAVKEAIYELVLQRKLDALDLQIIEARDCSPMPTVREIGLIVGRSHTTIEKRVARFQRLFAGL